MQAKMRGVIFNVIRRYSTANKFNEPLSGNDLTRAGGIASMMRLPVHKNADGKQCSFIFEYLDHGHCHNMITIQTVSKH